MFLSLGMRGTTAQEPATYELTLPANCPGRTPPSAAASQGCSAQLHPRHASVIRLSHKNATDTKTLYTSYRLLALCVSRRFAAVDCAHSGLPAIAAIASVSAAITTPVPAAPSASASAATAPASAVTAVASASAASAAALGLRPSFIYY